MRGAMARFLFLIILCATVGCASVRQYGIEQFLETTRYVGSSFSPDGSKILVSSDISGIFNAYAIDAETGEATALTESTTDAIFALSYFPDDERFLYTADQGGNELSHIYMRTPEGETTDLTPGENLRANFVGWTHDEKSFLVTTNERDPRYFDLYEIQLSDGSKALIFENTEAYEFASISPDKRTLAFNKPRIRLDTNIHLLDRTTGEMKLITAHEGNVAHRAMGFHPDGQHLLYTTDEGEETEFKVLMKYDLATGEKTELARPNWDVSFARYSKGGLYRMIGINENAATTLEIAEAASGRLVDLPELPGLSISSATISKDERRMVFYATGSSQPGDLYVHDFVTGEHRRLTRSLNPAIRASDLVDAERVRFDSFDGVSVPGLLYKPRQASARNKVPALVIVHGGPGGQTRLGYEPLAQCLVNRGYAVFAINNRGSSGYGKTFFAMDDHHHGDLDLKDCIESKRMLAETGFVDPERIGILGGSYGGYMVCAALAFAPEEFDVGVNIFGVTNWVRTLKSMPPWWEATRNGLYAELGNPFEEEEYLTKISPLFHAENIVKPMIVLQGANDPRVLQVESDEMVAAARAAGAPVEYIVFDDEGHGFRKRDNQIEGYGAIVAFLEKYLRGE